MVVFVRRLEWVTAMVQPHQLAFIISVCSRFPADIRDEILSSVYIRVSERDLEESNFERYVHNYANKVASAIRKDTAGLPLFVDIPDTEVVPGFYQVTLEDVAPGIDSLPKSWQEAIYTAAKFKSVSECAGHLGISNKAFISRKYRAMKRLRSWVKTNRPDLTEFL